MAKFPLAALCLLSLFLPSLAWADITGQPRIIDGDTLEGAGQRIRLHGIDAPEGRQLCRRDGEPWHCGKDATSALKALIGNRPVSCEELDRDRYRRIVAKCMVGRTDIGGWMVTEGWALAYRRYSIDYVPHEAKARMARKGIWRGDFMPPWKWRKMKRDKKRSPFPWGDFSSKRLKSGLWSYVFTPPRQWRKMVRDAK